MIDDLIEQFFPELLQIEYNRIYLCAFPLLSVCRPARGPLADMTIIIQGLPDCGSVVTCLISKSYVVCSIAQNNNWNPEIPMNCKYFEYKGYINKFLDSEDSVKRIGPLTPTKFYIENDWIQWDAGGYLGEFYSCVIEKY